MPFERKTLSVKEKALCKIKKYAEDVWAQRIPSNENRIVY